MDFVYVICMQGNMSATTYNNDGYILEVNGGGQRLFSRCIITPQATCDTPVNHRLSDLPMSEAMQGKSTLTLMKLLRAMAQYSLKDAQYILFSSNDVGVHLLVRL